MTDIRVTDHGSVVRFEILTEDGRSWIEEMVQIEGWQWLGNAAFAVDRRFAGPLIEGMTFDGLEVEL